MKLLNKSITYSPFLHAFMIICFLLFLGWKLELPSNVNFRMFIIDLLVEVSEDGDKDGSNASVVDKMMFGEFITTGIEPSLTEEKVEHEHGHYLDYTSSHYFTVIGPPPDVSFCYN